MSFFYDYSEEEARRFLQFVIDREPFMLSELARWMEQTGGPVDEMDGSVESLVPLWVWFVEFALDGYPTVSTDAVSTRNRAVSERELTDQRRHVATEPVEHYVFQVIKGIYADAHWDLFVDQGRSATHVDLFQFETGIRFDGDRWEQVGHRLRAMSFTIPGNIRNSNRPTKLRESIEEAFGPFASTRINFGKSILRRLVDEPILGISDLVVPILVPLPQIDEEVVGVRDEIVLARSSLRLGREKPGLSMESTRVGAELSALGFCKVDGTSLSGEDLSKDEAEFVWGEKPVLLQTRVVKGKLVALMFSAHGADVVDWVRMITALTDMARRFDARVGTTDSFA